MNIINGLISVSVAVMTIAAGFLLTGGVLWVFGTYGLRGISVLAFGLAVICAFISGATKE